MSRTTLIIVIITFILALSIVFGAFYFSVQNDSTPGVQEDQSFFETVFPFGSTPEERSRQQPETGDGERDVITTNQKAPALRLITRAPVSGAIVIERNTDGEPKEFVRYVERETGHFFETETETLNKAPLSNTTIPRVQEAIWSPNGEQVVLRLLNESGEIESFSAEVPETPGDQVDGSFLEVNLPYLATFDNEIGYTRIDEQGTSFIRSDYEGRAEREVFFSPLRELFVNWESAEKIAYGSKPSRLASSIAYYADTRTQRVERVGEDIALTFLAQPTSGELLVSFSDATSSWVDLGVYDTVTNEFTDISTDTLTEKCVWSKRNEDIAYCATPINIPQGIYPDDWYKGLISFSDEIWQVNTNTLETVRLIDLGLESGESIDATRLTLSPSGDYLVFINKRDVSLWSLRLSDFLAGEDGAN